MRTPNTISEAIENNNRPPAMRNAGNEMPSMVSSQWPTRANPVEHGGGDDGGTQCDALPGRPRHAMGDGKEARRKPDRIDHDEQRHQRRHHEIERDRVHADAFQPAAEEARLAPRRGARGGLSVDPAGASKAPDK